MVSTKSKRQIQANAKKAGTPRPANCFMLFRSNFTKTFNTTGPDQGAASVIAGEIWNDMPEEEKSPWRELGNTVKAEHKLAHPNYRFQRKPKQKVTGGRKKGKQAAEDTQAPSITPTGSQMLKQEVTSNPPSGMEDNAMEDTPVSESKGIANPFWTWPTASRSDLTNDCSPDIVDWERSPSDSPVPRVEQSHSPPLPDPESSTPTFSTVEPGPRSDVYPPARAIRRAIAKQ